MSSTDNVKPKDAAGPAITLLDASRISLPGILENIARFLTPNEIACTIRLVNKALAAAFRNFIVVRLSQLVPPHAFIQRWGSLESTASMPLRQRRELLFLTAASGCLRNLVVAAASAGLVLQTSPRQTAKTANSLNSTVLEAAAAAGRLGICIYLRDLGCAWAGALVAAATAGQTVVCEWLIANDCPWDRAAVYAAARGGHVQLMESLLAWRPAATPARDAVRAAGLLTAAAEGCDLPTLQRLYASPPHHDDAATRGAGGAASLLLSVDKAAMLLAAAGSPTADWQDKVLWLEATLGCGPGDASGGAGAGATRRLARAAVGGAAGACAKAASRPDALERVVWLHARGYPLSAAVAHAAAGAGNVPLLDFLLERGVRPGFAAAEAAAAAGQLEFLQALHARRLPVPWHVVEGAAEAGHLAVVMWLLGAEEHGEGLRTCVSERTVLGAARSGSTALMVWLLEQRRRWLSFVEGPVFRHAVEGGCGEALRLLVARGCSVEDNSDPYYVAAVNGDLATLRCLRELGCPWGAPGEVFGVCVSDGDCSQPVLAWLLEAGCPVGAWEGALAAAGRRNGLDREEVWAWLQQRQRLEGAQRAVAGMGIDEPSA